MTEQYFYIEKEIPEQWWVMAYLGVKTPSDYDKIYGTLLASGFSKERAESTILELKKPNTGYTLSDMARRASIFVVSHATNYVEFFNTVAHELQHLTSNICDYFDINHNGENAAYIQGEIGEAIYPAVALYVCPKCRCLN